MKKKSIVCAMLILSAIALTGCGSTNVDYAALAAEGTSENSVVAFIINYAPYDCFGYKQRFVQSNPKYAHREFEVNDKTGISIPMEPGSYYVKALDPRTTINWTGTASLPGSYLCSPLNTEYNFVVPSKPGFYVLFSAEDEERVRKNKDFCKDVYKEMRDCAAYYAGTAWEPLILAAMENWK